jgi:hypothetical protein
MKEVAILLLFSLALSGCGSSSSNKAVTAANDTWQAILSGGIGPASGLSFNTQFTVNSDASLNVESFQFLNKGSCFPVNGDAPSGTLDLTVNTTTDQVTGTFTFTVTSGGNTLALNGNVSGTEVNSALSGTTITGTWTLTGGNGCSDPTGGSFTMTEPTSSSTPT